MENSKNNIDNEVVGYYNHIANDYDDSRFNNSYGKFIDYEERRILDKLIDTSANSIRLDMACGTGRLTNYATHGLDASQEMMAHARQRYSDVTFHHASATNTKLDNCSFDIVYSFHFLMHVDEDTIQQVFNEVHRILKPGGRMIIDIPSRKRRTLLHHKQENWHGATDLNKDDIVRLAGNGFKLKRSFGVMMLPVHKLPVAMRKPLQKLDFALANSCLKQYSSYLVYELEKQ